MLGLKRCIREKIVVFTTVILLAVIAGFSQTFSVEAVTPRPVTSPTLTTTPSVTPIPTRTLTSTSTPRTITATVTTTATSTPRIPLSASPSPAPTLTPTPTATNCGPNIVLDGLFCDWPGKPNITDPRGDACEPDQDIAKIAWATNPGISTVFFYLERWTTDGHPFNGHNGWESDIEYWIRIDTDNDGGYFGDEDRLISIVYKPKADDGKVEVEVLSPDGKKKYADYEGDWGDSRPEGGLRVEVGVTFNDLGISVGQTIRFYAVSIRSNRECDRIPNSGDIQWSPIPVLGYGLLGMATAIAIYVTWRREGRKAWK